MRMIRRRRGKKIVIILTREAAEPNRLYIGS